MRKYLSNKLAIAIFALPALLVFSVMVFWPIVQTFYISLFNWNWLGTSKFIFLDNYKNLFSDDLFYTSLKNGLVFAGVLVILQIGIATILALALSDGTIWGSRFLRSAYFIPVVLSVTVVCQLWLSMYNEQFGLINKLFELLRVNFRQSWLSDERAAIFAIAIVNAWQFMGYHFVLIYTALKSIPEHYFEAAKIDGAGKARAHFHITLPLLGETYRFCLVLAATGGLNAFAQMLIMTGGGPGTVTYTLTYMTYRSAFRTQEFGYGCASAAILVIECLIATVLINKFVAKERITF